MQSGMSPTQKLKICFVSPYNYPLFNSDCHNIFGGWEVQIYHIAKEIARRGTFCVSIIVADVGQPHVEFREDVELITWEGRTFWGITPNLEEDLQEITERAALTIADIDPTNPLGSVESHLVNVVAKKRLSARIKKIYKQIISWRVRYIIHSLLQALVVLKTGLTQSFRAALEQVRAAVYNVTHALDVIGEMTILPEMVAVFAEAKADVYVAPGVSDVSALTAWYCTHEKIPYVMLAGSDRDFNPDILNNPDGKDLYQVPHSLLLYTIRHATCHIVQSQNQVEQAKLFGVSPVLIPNPINLEITYPRVANPQTILWVGNTEENVKQPSLMLKIIRDLPEYEFVMIVTPIQPDVYERLQAIAEQIPNVQLLSRIPYEEVEQYYAQAKLFVSTSTFEGFPNAFLQAGKYGVPIVSLNVDPNGMISKHFCGLLCNGEPGKVKEDIQSLMTDNNLYSRLSTNVFKYVHQFHNPEKIIPEYEAAFRSVLEESYYTVENER